LQKQNNGDGERRIARAKEARITNKLITFKIMRPEDS